MEHSTKELAKFTLTVSPTVPVVKLKRHGMETAHFDVSHHSALISIEPVIRNFRRKSSNVHLFKFLVKTFTFPQISNNFRPIFKINVFNNILNSNCMK